MAGGEKLYFLRPPCQHNKIDLSLALKRGVLYIFNIEDFYMYLIFDDYNSYFKLQIY